MKKIVVALLLAALSSGSVNAQFLKNTQAKSNKNWQNLSLEEQGVYGAEIDKAYELLKGKQAKKVTIALIGTGVDITHPDLLGSIWNNPNEKLNNKDDDKNGLIDDINGWNFLGNEKGDIVELISKQGDRDFLRLNNNDDYTRRVQVKAKGVVLEETILNEKKHTTSEEQEQVKYYIFDGDKNTLVETNAPKDKEEYKYFKKLEPESELAAKAGVSLRRGVNKALYKPLYEDFKKNNPDKEVTIENINDYFKEDAVDSLQNMAIWTINANAKAIVKFSEGSTKWSHKQALDWLLDSVANNTKEYDQALANYQIRDTRGIIGDNPYDINDRFYGNNSVKTNDAIVGTLSAGIIGATRNNNIGINGIADKVEIMTLRIEADDQGEIYLKDMALAIRYAVDNGAEIIQMPKSNTLYPIEEAVWVNEALTYAEEKGVLVVMANLDSPYNLNTKPLFPNKYLPGGKELSNFITVAASDGEGNPLDESAFGKEYLDLYAPGVEIYSTYLGGTYRSGTSSRFAASMVVGVAALLKSYYPKLTASQIKNLILQNVTSRSDEEIEKKFYVFYPSGGIQDAKKDLFSFGDLCASGGILNAYKTVKAAQEIEK